ncbi:MAG TPA: hypothetical protein VHT70_02980 [Candidatus Saccharimonadales bacterium]|jgi:hypothetical protein|nr:hypothetical protein [Candidatus Saccharimonadales bacterium]
MKVQEIAHSGSSLRPAELLQSPQEVPYGTQVTPDEVAQQAFQQNLHPIVEPSGGRGNEISETPLSEADVIEQRRTAVAEANSFLRHMTEAIRVGDAVQQPSDGSTHRYMRSTWRDGNRWAFLAVSGEVNGVNAETGRRTVRPTAAELMLINNDRDHYPPTVLRTEVGDDHLEIRDEIPSSGNFPGHVWEITDDSERKEMIQRAEGMVGLLVAGEATIEVQTTQDLIRMGGALHPYFYMPRVEHTAE